MTDSELTAEHRRTQHEIETAVYVGKLEDNQATLKRRVLALRSDCAKLTNMVGSLIAQRDEFAGLLAGAILERNGWREKYEVAIIERDALNAALKRCNNELNE